MRLRLFVFFCLAWPLSPTAASAQTVDSVVASHSGGCTTAGFEGLSEQLVRSHLCAFPGTVADFMPHAGISLTSSRVHTLATAETVAALHAAADRTSLSITSAFRPLVQQYALFNEGGCGLAATPGNSNHQTGRAVDVSNYSAALTALLDAGCTHPYPGSDPVHFDCPGADMRSASVLVFQRLWNLNNPSDTIAEDGAYGPQTGARLGRSPVGGFGMDLCDTAPPMGQWGGALLATTFENPITLRPGEQRLGTIEVSNIGTETWNSSTRLGTTGPRDRTSELAADDWIAGNRPAQVVGTVAPGDSFPFTFTVRAPMAAGDYTTTFGLLQEGVIWFSDPSQLGPPDDVLLVRVVVSDEPPPVVGTDAGGGEVDAGVSPEDGGVSGSDGGWTGGEDRPLGVEGCSLSASRRGAAPYWLLGLALWILRRSRSR